MSITQRLAAGRPFWWFPERVNEPALRLVATVVALTLALAWWRDLPWLVPVLALGYLLRAVAGPRLSPLARTAAWVAKACAFRPRVIGGAPKQLAAIAGATLLGAASATLFCGASTVGWALAGTVVLFATLEATLGFCVVCRLYAWVIPCPDCSAGSAADTCDFADHI
ncbi:MAG: DUF4395 domain-containing protein [Myxococcota bacterium]